MRDNFDVYEWNIRKIREEKNISGDEAVTKTIEFLRKSIYPKLTDDEMDKFVVGICEFMDCTPPTYRLNEDLSENFDKVSGGIPYKVENGNAIISIPLPDDAKERIIKRAEENGYSASPNMAGGVTIRKKGLNEDENTLNKIADILGDKFDNLRFDVNTLADRIDVNGSQQDLMNFGSKLHGSKIYGYEVFHTDDDDRGEIVRIVKSDSISRGGVNEEYKVAGRTVKINKGKNPDGTDWTVTFPNGKIADLADVLALIDPKPELTKEDKKKADRCLRIARRKMPQSSAYRSGLIVKCRKGMIWKKEK